MSDDLRYNPETGTKFVKAELDLLTRYFEKIGYTITQTSTSIKQHNGQTVLIRGIISASSPDGYSHRCTTEIPVCADGKDMVDLEHSIVRSMYPEMDTVLAP